MVVGCGGGGNKFWLLMPGGGNSNPNAWRGPEGNCKGYKSNGYDGLVNARMNGGNIAAAWTGCGPIGPPIFRDPITGDPIKDPGVYPGPIMPIFPVLP